MAGNSSEGLGDDFFEQILAVPSSAYSSFNMNGAQAGGYGRAGGGGGEVGSIPPMVLQLGSGGDGSPAALRGGMGMPPPLGLNLEQGHGFLRQEDGGGSLMIGIGGGGGRFSEEVSPSHNTALHHHHLVHNNSSATASPSNSATTATSNINDDPANMRSLFQGFGHMQPQSLRPTVPPPPPQIHQPFHSQPPAQQLPAIRPRVRARRGQATDPHSIAERLRRERIAERMRALQELVPSANKTDRAAMLDEIVDYIKFLRLQVKVLSMSRLGGAGAVARLVADVPLATVKDEGIEGDGNQQAWDKWSNDGTEQEVAKLMEEDVGAAMQFLQSKALCIMPISLASAIFRQSDTQTLIKHESNTHS